MVKPQKERVFVIAIATATPFKSAELFHAAKFGYLKDQCERKKSDFARTLTDSKNLKNQ